MHQPPYPPYPPPPPEQPPRFLRFGVGGAVVIILISVVGTFARIHNERTAEEIETKKAALPTVGSQGTLKGSSPALCPVPKIASSFGWPCGSERRTSLAPSSKVRVMKAGMFGRDALCRYWVQGGPQDNASGDAPCEWFAPE